jgi:hypothetical protein
MLQYDWLWSGHMIIKEMFYITIKLKPYVICLSILFKNWISALHTKNVLRPTFFHANKTTKKCIQFLNIWTFRKSVKKMLDYLLLEITTPLIVYIWRRHGGTCKFGFKFYGVLDTTLCNKACLDLRQVSGFLWVLLFSPPIKLTAPI